ncbi:hypothetical protein [Methylobacterium oryzae]|uniref:hypothetical protein n=1 Tax=Methylobacterium oryzae TaxID=334852 RepID=UPI003AF6E68A
MAQGRGQLHHRVAGAAAAQGKRLQHRGRRLGAGGQLASHDPGRLLVHRRDQPAGQGFEDLDLGPVPGRGPDEQVRLNPEDHRLEIEILDA